MPARCSTIQAVAAHDELDCFYEYENIQDQLNRMTEPQLESDYAHRLMDRAAFIRGMWRK